MEIGRPQKLKREIREFICATLQDNPKMSVSKIHTKLHDYLIAKRKELHPELSLKRINEEIDNNLLDDECGLQLPGESAIDKWLRENKIREEILKREKQPEKLDQPWSMGSLINFPIYDPTLLKVVSDFADRIRKGGKSELLIRDALWIARLYVIPLENQARSNIEEDYHQKLLYEVAFCYSFMERLMEIEKYGAMDTSLFDGDTLEETGRNFIEFYKKYPNLPQFEELQNLLKDDEANG